MNQDYLTFKTSNNNRYLYSFNRNQILLLHPLIHYFLELDKNRNDILKWIKSKKKHNINFQVIGYVKQKDLFYYYNKYLFLKNSSFFEKINERENYYYNANDIEKFLANSPQISFEVTDKCNLACEYCIYGKYYYNRTKPQQINLNIAKAKNILNYLVKIWNSSLNTSHNRKISIGFYGGEPLMNFEFIKEIVNYSKKLKLNHNTFSFNMTTNGVLLSKYLPFLVENKFNLLISLDGESEYENSYRKFPNQKNSFREIFVNVTEIQNKYPEYFDKHVNFNCQLPIFRTIQR